MVISRIKEMRKNKGLTQQQLADLVGCAKRTLQDLEDNRCKVERMALETALKMAEVLECEPKDLYTVENTD